MKTIIAIPTKEVAGVKFGQKRADVRIILGDYKEYKKNKFSKTTSDDFGYCHVYYNSKDELSAVEFFDEVSIFIDKKKIFPMAADSIKKDIDDLIIEEESMISKSLSIGITINDGQTESILFAESGYYD